MNIVLGEIIYIKYKGNENSNSLEIIISFSVMKGGKKCKLQTHLQLDSETNQTFCDFLRVKNTNFVRKLGSSTPNSKPKRGCPLNNIKQCFFTIKSHNFVLQTANVQSSCYQ